MTFARGDIVKLKIGGPPMLVEEVSSPVEVGHASGRFYDVPRVYTVIWLEHGGGALCRAEVHESMLLPAQLPRRQWMGDRIRTGKPK